MCKLRFCIALRFCLASTDGRNLAQDENIEAGFEREALALAQMHEDVCMVKFGKIVYLTATDAEVLTAAMGWALDSSGSWSHFVSMTGQVRDESS